jgi:hypothetical protein
MERGEHQDDSNTMGSCLLRAIESSNLGVVEQRETPADPVPDPIGLAATG